MIFIDASAYLSLLNPNDINHQAALEAARNFGQLTQVTSQAVLGEVLTVGSMRFDKRKTIKLVNKILKSSTLVILENESLVKQAWEIFKKVPQKNISWVDCYSQAIMNFYQIEQVFTFDRDFAQLANFHEA